MSRTGSQTFALAVGLLFLVLILCFQNTQFITFSVAGLKSNPESSCLEPPKYTLNLIRKTNLLPLPRGCLRNAFPPLTCNLVRHVLMVIMFLTARTYKHTHAHFAQTLSLRGWTGKYLPAHEHPQPSYRTLILHEGRKLKNKCAAMCSCELLALAGHINMPHKTDHVLKRPVRRFSLTPMLFSHWEIAPVQHMMT